jgi:hypothetical protein
MSPLVEFLVPAAVAAVAIAFQFKIGWILAIHFARLVVWVVRWAVILGLVTGVLCSSQAYRALGWTPLSLIYGDQFYARLAAKEHAARAPRLRLSSTAPRRPILQP